VGLDRNQRRFLRQTFPGDGCVLDAEAAAVFGMDSSRLADAPWAVVRPETEEQAVALLAWAHSERVPLFPRARGTNVVGDCVPRGGGVVVSTLRMNRILEMDGEDFCAVVQPGVVTGDLQRELAALGLMYAPDPASVRVSTVGGNVATNAGGMRAVKYGVTREHVLGVRAVLPGGDVLRTGGRNHKNVVGLDLTRLFVGSEGTLGLFTELTLKLLPLPEATASVLAGYAGVDQALAAARAVLAAGILPTAMEFMAEAVLEAVRRVGDVPWGPEVRAALLLRLDGGREALEAETRRLDRVLGPTAPVFLERGTGADEERLWEVRRLINPASFTIAPDKMSDDITVPRGRVGQALERIRAVAEQRGLDILAFGHLGDGNIHVNIMYDASRQAEDAVAAKRTILGHVLALGGTMSGEHGVGLTKLPYLDQQLSPRERDLMRRIKAAFDPHGIMNPGKAY
jgi:D-lactate dehydrogenase (cytochrome)/glycolate oxidase